MKTANFLLGYLSKHSIILKQILSLIDVNDKAQVELNEEDTKRTFLFLYNFVIGLCDALLTNGDIESDSVLFKLLKDDYELYNDEYRKQAEEVSNEYKNLLLIQYIYAYSLIMDKDDGIYSVLMTSFNFKINKYEAINLIIEGYIFNNQHISYKDTFRFLKQNAIKVPSGASGVPSGASGA